MATNKTQAAKLLNAAEMEVFNASLAPAIKELDAVRLAGKVKRARTLRDKFRDLLQRQKVAARQRTGNKIGTGGSANQRTAKKAEVFDEILQRLSARLEQVQAAAAREATRSEKAKSASAAKSAGAAKKSPPKAPARRVAGEPPARSAKAPAVAPVTAGTGVGPGSQRARVAAKDARLALARPTLIQPHREVE